MLSAMFLLSSSPLIVFYRRFLLGWAKSPANSVISFGLFYPDVGWSMVLVPISTDARFFAMPIQRSFLTLLVFCRLLPSIFYFLESRILLSFLFPLHYSLKVLCLSGVLFLRHYLPDLAVHLAELFFNLSLHIFNAFIRLPVPFLHCLSNLFQLNVYLVDYAVLHVLDL